MEKNLLLNILEITHTEWLCGFIPTLWSYNKPNMVSLSQAIRQSPTSLVEKPDETLGLCLVVSL